MTGPGQAAARSQPGDAGELARVAGISWRLAARIVAAREAFEGREDRPRDPDGDPLPAVSEPAGADAEQGPHPPPAGCRRAVSAPLLPIALAFALGAGLGLAVEAPVWLGPVVWPPPLSSS